MRSSRLIQWLPLPLAVLLVVGVLTLGRQGLASSQAGPNLAAGTYQAQVIEILEAGDVDLGDMTQPYQVFRARVLEGPWAEVVFEVDYGRRQVRAPGPPIRPGEQILVTVSQAPGALPQAYFVDFVRTPSLTWLLAAFVAVSLLISGWKGLRSRLAMAASLTVIIGYLLPSILRGDDPVTTSIAGAFVILASTLYLVYGWTLKTHAAVLGTLLALVLTGLLAALFVEITRLTGFGSEDAMFLSQQSAAPLNLRGLVLGGILIGALGVLDDLVITQASAVFEIYAADPGTRFSELFRRGMRIGQDHVAATVNTLVLAYAGATLPLLLLVSSSGEQWINFLNREYVAEEIVRTLVGSLGLMGAVPLTTALACAVALNQSRLGVWRAFLGPATLNDGHQHFH